MRYPPLFDRAFEDLPQDPRKRNQFLKDAFGYFLVWSMSAAHADSKDFIENENLRSELEPNRAVPFANAATQLDKEQQGVALNLADATLRLLIRNLLAMLTSQGSSLRIGTDHAVGFKLIAEVRDENLDIVFEEVINRGGGEAFQTNWPRWLRLWGEQDLAAGSQVIQRKDEAEPPVHEGDSESDLPDTPAEPTDPYLQEDGTVAWPADEAECVQLGRKLLLRDTAFGVHYWTAYARDYLYSPEPHEPFERPWSEVAKEDKAYRETFATLTDPQRDRISKLILESVRGAIYGTLCLFDNFPLGDVEIYMKDGVLGEGKRSFKIAPTEQELHRQFLEILADTNPGDASL